MAGASLADGGGSQELAALVEHGLLDDRVRSGQDRLRERQAQRLRRLKVDHQLELGGLLDREVSGFGALQNLVYVGGGAMEAVGDVRSVGHEAAGLRELSGSENGRQLVFLRKVPDESSVSRRQPIEKH